MQRQPVVSSNIKAIGFEAGVLEVEFVNGRIYAYSGQQAERCFEDMKKAASVGSYFAKNVRNNPTLISRRVDEGEKA